jgi:hypothetical protein
VSVISLWKKQAFLKIIGEHGGEDTICTFRMFQENCAR